MKFRRLAFAFVLLFNACSDNDPPKSNKILNVINSDDHKQATTGDATTAFDSLAKYVNKYQDIQELLYGSSDVTFFAPSNTAFVALTALPGLANLGQINPDIIRDILAYHITASRMMKSDLTPGTMIPTEFNFEKIVVNQDGTLKTGSKNGSITITTADVDASNGVLHITDAVLIPVSTGAEFSNILGTLAGPVLLGKDFTYMAYMIERADAEITDPLASFASLLSIRTVSRTLLAIPNEVFEKAYNDAHSMGTGNKPTTLHVKQFIDGNWTEGLNGSATATLRNHVIGGKYTVAVVAGASQFNGDMSPLTAYSGKELVVNTNVPLEQCGCSTGVIIGINRIGRVDFSIAPVITADIDTEAGISNGVMHVVGGMLIQ